MGCLENTMTGNDRSGTVDINLNLFKAVELTLARGGDPIEYKDQIGASRINKRHSADTGDSAKFESEELRRF